MFRSGASRSLLRTINAATFKTTSSPGRQQIRSQLCTSSYRPLAKPSAPKTLSLVRWQSTVDKIDTKREEKIQGKTLKPTPETVSSTSTISPAIGTPDQQPDPGSDPEPQMMSGIYGDLQTIRDTFSLEEVPNRAYYMGMAGVIPYAATAMSTVYCAWEINHAANTGSGFLMSERTAETLLHIIEPIQVGYGAVILSFLGAIHWGLEWAKYGGEQGYPRYFIGVASTAVAWPTIFLPVEYALITQFLAFNFLYYTDTRAKTRGWAPQWYGVYRFVLTFIVGASIVASLIGRGQIADRVGSSHNMGDRIKAFREGGPDQVEEEESARRRFLAEEEDEDEEGGDEDEE
ncbi:hypothetical protein LTR37_000862 [Vermiconidia calcicola]|uniref:Uncharacterized protein n=1 Tax=Vermiconidia calcicola TaxID=1690605 RepID=A0ACC3NZY9_9PEZI|nr:hypothetical protein LTR37_000862 [Vermiconidia calcicola]